MCYTPMWITFAQKMCISFLILIVFSLCDNTLTDYESFSKPRFLRS